MLATCSKGDLPCDDSVFVHAEDPSREGLPGIALARLAIELAGFADLKVCYLHITRECVRS